LRRRVSEASIRMVAQPLAVTPQMILARHALLHQMFAIYREDLDLRWWSGGATFAGQAPPRRLLRWQGPRRVREMRSRTSLAEILMLPEATDIVSALLRRSPLTVVLTLCSAAFDAQTPFVGAQMTWENAVPLLRHTQLARALLHAALPAADPSCSALGRLALAFDAMLDRSPAGDDLRAVLGFLIFAAATLCDNGPDAEWLRADALPGRAKDRGVALFASLPHAAALVDARLGEVPGVNADRWRRFVSAGATWAGAAVVEPTVARIRKHMV
jgi:hypothetical protein